MLKEIALVVIEVPKSHLKGDAFIFPPPRTVACCLLTQFAPLRRCSVGKVIKEYGGGPGGMIGFSVRYQGELLGIWDPQNRDLRQKLPPETTFSVV